MTSKNPKNGEVSIECVLANIRISDLLKNFVPKPPPSFVYWLRGRGWSALGTSATVILDGYLFAKMHVSDMGQLPPPPIKFSDGLGKGGGPCADINVSSLPTSLKIEMNLGGGGVHVLVTIKLPILYTYYD